MPRLRNLSRLVLLAFVASGCKSPEPIAPPATEEKVVVKVTPPPPAVKGSNPYKGLASHSWTMISMVRVRMPDPGKWESYVEVQYSLSGRRKVKEWIKMAEEYFDRPPEMGVGSHTISWLDVVVLSSTSKTHAVNHIDIPHELQKALPDREFRPFTRLEKRVQAAAFHQAKKWWQTRR